MRIDGWRVDGFGVFAGASVEDLPPGLTVVSGPNEAGKSTLLAFLRGVMFGFPDGRSRARRHEPVHGGRHGGAVMVQDGDGARWVVERHLQPRTFTLRGPDGALAESHRLGDLLGHADASLFSNVFAFGLGELDSFELLDSDEVRDRVFAAGVVGGGRSARAALDTIDERRSALLRPRGHSTIRDLADRTRAASRDLAVARAGAVDLVARREEVAALLDEVAARRAAVEASRTAVGRASVLVDAWPAHRRLAELEERLAPFESMPTVGDETIARLAARRADLVAATGTLAQVDDDLAEACGRRDAVVVDDQIHALAGPIAAIGDELGAEVARTERLAELDGLVDARRGELDEQLRRLGPEWDREHLAGFDVSIPAADEVRRLGERASTLRAELEARVTDGDALRSELVEVEDERQQIDARSDDRGEGQDLERRSRAMRQLRADLVDLGNETSRLDAAHGTVSGLTTLSSKGGRSSTKGILIVAFGILLGLAGVAAASQSAEPIGIGLVITGVSAAVLGVVVLMSGRSSAAPDVVAGIRSELREARRVRDETQARIELLRTRIHASALVLGLPAEPSADDVERCATDIESAERRVQTRVADKDRRRDLVERSEQLRSQVGDLDAEVAALEDRVAADDSEWEEWTRTRRIPAELGVSAVNDLFTGIERARVVHRELAAAEVERARLDEASSRWREQAFEVSARADVDESIDPLVTVRMLVRRVTDDDEARRALDERTSAVLEIERRREHAEAVASQARQALDDVWQEMGVDSDEEADVVVERSRQQQLLRAEIEAARAEVQAAVGRGPTADDLLSALADGAVEVWEATVRDETERLPSLEAEHEAAIRVHHDAERDLEQLSRTADVAEAGLRLEAHRTELAGAVEEWRTLTAARTLIADTLSRYERERQPAVLARAEEWFAHITDGHYETVTVADGEIVLVDSAGRRLTTDDLSRGTSEQLYLCLRFGLAAEMVTHTPLPFVMDDVLVNFDPERTQRMAEVLASIAADHQVLLFTCQPSTVDALLRAAPSARVVELPRHGGVG